MDAFLGMFPTNEDCSPEETGHFARSLVTSALVYCYLSEGGSDEEKVWLDRGNSVIKAVKMSQGDVDNCRGQAMEKFRLVLAGAKCTG